MLLPLLSAALLCASSALAATPQSPTGVVINEINYDDTGSDDFEFVELFNGSAVAVDISNWTLNGIDGTTSGNGTHTIAPGTVLQPGAFWVVGDSGVPNVDEVISGLGLENGADGVFLMDGNFIYQDGVCWETADWTNTLPLWLEGDGLWGAIQGVERPTGTLVLAMGRGVDGVDTDDNGCDFRPMPATPGELNVIGLTTSLPYADDFDGAVTNTVDADFAYSFTPGNTQDPAAIQGAIITGIPQPTFSIPASPQGGNVSVWHDPTGGGNANWLRCWSASDFLLETYVYVPGPNANLDADDGEQWSIGVRGHSDSFGEFSDLGGFYSMISCGGGSAVQPGHTGIAWTCQRTASLCDLYLVDFNNGGGDPIVLAGPIAIQAGVNDGWQRVRISAMGSDVVANFGGTYGCDDGVRVAAQTNTTCANGVYLTYRECITDNNNLMPLVLDRLLITDGTPAGAQLVGAGSATTQGVPTVAASGPPVLGDAGFAIQAGNLLGSPLSGCLLDLGPPLAGVPLPGGAPTAQLYADPTLILLQVPFGNATSFALPLPCQPLLSGLELTAQVFDWDATLPYAFPVGLSPGLVLQLGY
ncbi:MAG: lamin tail domain-containing protein [Planctomycetota bacterium]